MSLEELEQAPQEVPEEPVEQWVKTAVRAWRLMWRSRDSNDCKSQNKII